MKTFFNKINLIETPSIKNKTKFYFLLKYEIFPKLKTINSNNEFINIISQYKELKISYTQPVKFLLNDDYNIKPPNITIFFDILVLFYTINDCRYEMRIIILWN